MSVVLTSTERKDVGRLLGLDWQASGKAVSLGALRAALAQHTVTLEGLLEDVGGPLRDLQRDRAREATAREALTSAGRTALVDAGVPGPVVAALLARRWLPSGAELVPLADQLGAIIRAVRAEPDTPGQRPLLATLATDLFKDPHALDMGRPLGRAAARILAACAAHASGASDDDIAAGPDPCRDAASWRAAWAGAGVACDLVSSTVLALNVTVASPGAAHDLLQVAAQHGEPVWVTARAASDLAAVDGALVGHVVRVCENPAVVEAAANRYAAACPPLVCTYGRPSAAALMLLGALAGSGAQLLITGDRDSAGLSITASLMAQFPTARPWLPDAAGTYEEERLSALLNDLARPLG